MRNSPTMGLISGADFLGIESCRSFVNRKDENSTPKSISAHCGTYEHDDNGPTVWQSVSQSVSHDNHNPLWKYERPGGTKAIVQ